MSRHYNWEGSSKDEQTIWCVVYKTSNILFKGSD